MRSLRVQGKDIVLDGINSFEVIRDDNEFAQSIRLLIETSLGEWFLEPDIGMDYEPLKEKNFNEDIIRFALIDCLSQESTFDELTEFNLQVENRIAYIDFKARFGDSELGLSIEQEV